MGLLVKSKFSALESAFVIGLFSIFIFVTHFRYAQQMVAYSQFLQALWWFIGSGKNPVETDFLNNSSTLPWFIFVLFK